MSSATSAVTYTSSYTQTLSPGKDLLRKPDDGSYLRRNSTGFHYSPPTRGMRFLRDVSLDYSSPSSTHLTITTLCNGERILLGLIIAMDDIPEPEQPPYKRLYLSTLGSKYEAGESSTARPTRVRGIDYGFCQHGETVWIVAGGGLCFPRGLGSLNRIESGYFIQDIHQVHEMCQAEGLQRFDETDSRRHRTRWLRLSESSEYEARMSDMQVSCLALRSSRGRA
ncbi:hypothetical protein Tco_0941898 [Tanacetum coccineum]|uniref:Uncharacterized protein n=1 Tax=Tanacetum coccineum TaxID=301880 RepID=A0ABQ5DTU4_9ASTR